MPGKAFSKAFGVGHGFASGRIGSGVDITAAAQGLHRSSLADGLAKVGSDYIAIMDELDDAADRAMLGAAHRGRTEAVQTIGMVASAPWSEAKFNPIDTGEMRRSYRVDKIAGGAVLENVATHAAHQEFGTRPFTPSLDVLTEWARRKVWTAKPKKKKNKGGTKRKRIGKKRPHSKLLKHGPRQMSPENRALHAAQDKQANDLAKKAWNSIRRRGIIPKNFHAAASQKFGQYTEEELLKRWRKVRQ